jgi:hypothetical protein
MQALKLEQQLIDTRTRSIATIVDISDQPKGLLYTVQYGDNEYRRYYEHRLMDLFKPIVKERKRAKPKAPTIPAHENVTFMDFRSKTKFANYPTWYEWIKLLVK